VEFLHRPNIGLNTGLRVTYIGEHSIQLGFAPNLTSLPTRLPSTPCSVDQPSVPYWGASRAGQRWHASYEALQVEANRRYKNGLTFTAPTPGPRTSPIRWAEPDEFGGRRNGRIMTPSTAARIAGTTMARAVIVSSGRRLRTAVRQGQSHLTKANALVDVCSRLALEQHPALQTGLT